MRTIREAMSRMRSTARGDNIWGLALGYFLAYIPYAFTAKATTDGLLPDVPSTPGLALLPVSAIATLGCLYLFVATTGWWRYLVWRRLAGIPVPAIRLPAILSGLSTAIIIGSTTMAYSFHGISIVLMLVLMKAGVLIIARVTDLVTGRNVRWESLTAFLLTLAALAVTLTGQNGLLLSPSAVICIAAYLAGYSLRFQIMHHLSSKGAGQDEMLRYFVEEQAVALPVLMTMCGAWGMMSGDAAADLRAGFALLAGGPALIPALLVGAFYAALYVFGTLIYLHPREYTYCVPINRASSILSGVVASFAIAVFFQRPLPSSRDLLGAAILITALLVLAMPALRAVWEARRRTASLERLFIFVCAGNTARSPIAQAICTAEMAAYLGITHEELDRAGIRVVSAGLRARVGKPMKPEAIAALDAIGVPAHDHAAQQITPEMLDRAAMVFCMTEEQRLSLLELTPHAASKIRCLASEGDLDEPVGHEATLAFARNVHGTLRSQLDEVMMAV